MTVVEEFMKNPNTEITIKVGNTYLTAALNQNPISKDFIRILPLNLKLIDLSGIKKYARLLTELSEEGAQIRTCEVGDLAYWSPGPGLVIFYRQETAMVDSGLYLLGKMNIDVGTFNSAESLDIKIELIE